MGPQQSNTRGGRPTAHGMAAALSWHPFMGDISVNLAVCECPCTATFACLARQLSCAHAVAAAAAVAAATAAAAD